MPTTPAQPMPGRKLGRYQLTARMAVGGMAEVWLAQSVGISGFHKMVVLKTILPHLATDPAYVQMFKQEAVLAAHLNHKNIVQIYELGEADGIYFIAMEHLLGRTLRQVLRKAQVGKGLLPPWLVINVIIAVCEALDFAHHATGDDGKPMNLVHRDVTPDNIMVTFAGTTKVLDFGIAKGDTSQNQTAAGTLKGKFAYIAPERILAAHGNASADKRSDVFSVGAILYEMLTGTLPFAEKDDIALLRRILDGTFTPLRQHQPEYPPRLEEIAHKALAKDPVQRYQTCAELAEDLSRFVAEVRQVVTTERHVGQYLSGLFHEEVTGDARARTVALETRGFDPVKNEAEPVVAASPFSSPDAHPARSEPNAVPRAQASSVAFNEALVDAMDVDARPCILVVDGDRVSRRFAELALGRDEKYRVVSVANGKAALETMQTRLVDLIISEADLPDMKALELFARVNRGGPQGATPFIVLSAETKVTTRVGAIAAGVDAFLLKPCDAVELQARVEGLLERQKRLRDLVRRRPYVLAGSFSSLALQDLAGLLEMERRTGTLAISGPSVVGEVGFEEGRVMHATVGELSGDQAFFRLLAEKDGQFEFSLLRRAVNGAPMTMSATELVMEGARLTDHQRRDESSGKSLKAKVPVAVVTDQEVDASLIAPADPDEALGKQFELGVRDGFALGELRLSSEEEAVGWMLSPTGEQRFHVHLVAEMGEGVSSMLGLAAPPTEREVLVGLNAEPKLLSLDFFLRNDRLLDVLLLDIKHPAEFREALIHRPSLYIIAPPGGDFLSVGTDARVQLEQLLERLHPTVVLGVGNQSMLEALPQLPYLRRPDVRTVHISGALGKGVTDLRNILVYGIRFWATPSARPPATT